MPFSVRICHKTAFQKDWCYRAFAWQAVDEPAFHLPNQDHITSPIYSERKSQLKKESINKYTVKTGFMHVLVRLFYLFTNLAAIVIVKLLKIYKQIWL